MNFSIGGHSVVAYRATLRTTRLTVTCATRIGLAVTANSFCLTIGFSTGCLTAVLPCVIDDSHGDYIVIGLECFRVLVDNGVPAEMFGTLPLTTVQGLSPVGSNSPSGFPEQTSIVDGTSPSSPLGQALSGLSRTDCTSSSSTSVRGACSKSRDQNSAVPPSVEGNLPPSDARQIHDAITLRQQTPANNGPAAIQSSVSAIHNSFSHLSNQYEGIEGYELLRTSLLGTKSRGMCASFLRIDLEKARHILKLHGLRADGLNLEECHATYYFHIFSGDCAEHRVCHGDRTACIQYRKGFDCARDLSYHAFKLLGQADNSVIMHVVKCLNISTSFKPNKTRQQCQRLVMELAESYTASCSLLPNSSFLRNFDRASKSQLLAVAHSHLIPVNRFTATKDSIKDLVLGHFVSGRCYAHANKIQNKRCTENVADVPPPVTTDHSMCIKWLQKHMDEFTVGVFRRIFALLEVAGPDASDVATWRAALTKYLRTQASPTIDHHASPLNNHFDDVRALWPSIAPQQVKENLIADFRDATSNAALSYGVCGSCSSSVLKSSLEYLSEEDLDLRCFLRPDKRPLNWDGDINSDQTADSSWIKYGYTSPPFEATIPGLPDVILDGDGVEADNETDTYKVALCPSCCSSAKNGRVPPLALSNHNFLGDTPPELSNLTSVEEALISRCRVQKIICHIKESGKKPPAQSSPSGPSAQRHYKGHTILFPQKSTKILNMLPPPVDELRDAICILFVGSSKPTDEWVKQNAKPLFVRRQRVENAIRWLKANNPLYADVSLNYSALSTLPTEGCIPVHIEHVVPTKASESLTSRYDEKQVEEEEYFRDGLRVSDRDNNDYSAPFPSVAIADVNPNATAADLKRAAGRHFARGGKHLLVGHDIKPASEFFNTNLFPSVYPTLFPYGLGGFENKARSTPLSLQYQARRLLNLKHRLFERHPAFIFTIFNLIQRRLMLLHSSLKVKKSSVSRMAESFAALSPNVVHSVSLAVAEGKPRRDFSREEMKVYDLLREVNVVTSFVPGSSASRVAMRNEIRAMMIEKGLPTFYITINPADTMNPIVRLLAGEDIDLDNLLEEAPSDDWRQSIFIAQHPALTARFFDHYMNAFLQTLLKYSPDNGSTGEGVFGATKAYYGCVEAQGRGSLHCHMLVWIEGAHNVDQIKKRLIADNDAEFGRDLLAYLDDCISTQMPSAVPGARMSTAHPCSTRGPHVDRDNEDNELSADAANDLRQLVDACQVHRHNDTCWKYSKEKTSGEPRTCRFDLDEKNTLKTSYIDGSTGDIHLRKLDGMINNFNDTMLRALRNNMDVKFIGSGPSAKAVLYYITDYITKSQLETHVAYAALDCAIQKIGEYDADQTDIATRAKRLLQRSAYMMIKHQELSAQQVSAYLLGLPDHYKSHECENMFWTSFESHINSSCPSPECYGSTNTDGCSPKSSSGCAANVPVNSELTECERVEPLVRADQEGDALITDASDTDESNTQTDDDNVEQRTSSDDGDADVTLDLMGGGTISARPSKVNDYSMRSLALTQVCLWDYIAQFSKTKAKPKNPDTEQYIVDFEMTARQAPARNQPTYEFLADHPECATHCVKLRPYTARKHPNPLGPALPRRDMADSAEKHARLMLIFFKPWRTAADIKENYLTWTDAYNAFLEGSSARILAYIDNMQLIHECKDSRDDHFTSRNRERRRNIVSVEQGEEAFNASDEAAIEDAILDHLIKSKSARSMIKTGAQREADACVDAAVRTGLFSSRQEMDLSDFCDVSTGEDITNQPSVNEELWKAQYDQRHKAWKEGLRAVADNGDDSAEHSFDTVAATMESHLTWNDAPAQPEATSHITVGQSTPTISATDVNPEEIIKEYELNGEQQRAFLIIIEHSLSHSAEPLRMFLGGHGGTGKSTVISAVNEYFVRNGQERRFRLSSYTGVAAKNINGMTLHSALSLNQRRNNRLSEKSKRELIAMWDGVDYLFIDEVSMIGCRFLLQISEALADAKQCDLPFGGINIIFAGDFAQLPPVADRRLCATISNVNVATPNGLNAVLGKLLWCSVSTVVILQKIMRQEESNNAEFLELLSRLRKGECTTDDYNLLRTRVATSRDLTSNLSQWRDVPMVVSKNECKDALNVQAVENFGRATGQDVHWYYASDKWAGQSIGNVDLQLALWGLASNKCNAHLGRLPLVINMPVMLSTNYDVQGGAVNGCMGILKDIRYTTDRTGKRFATSCVIESSTVTCACMHNLQQNQIVALQSTTKICIRHPDSGQVCRIDRTQLPILPAFSITAHKAQGQTLTKAIIDLQSCSGTESPYVMLSRVKSLDGVLILRPFNIAKIQCRRNPEVRAEFRRQELLRLHTLRRYGSPLEQKDAGEKLQRYKFSVDEIAPPALNRDFGDVAFQSLTRLEKHIDSAAYIEDDVLFSGRVAVRGRNLKRKMS